MEETIFSTFNKGLYRINNSVYSTSDEVSSNGIVNISPDQISSGGSTDQMNMYVGAIVSGKQGFTNNEAGYILGIDADDGKAKFYIGNASSYLNWDGTNLTVVGNVNISSINIPDSTTANSFHVDSSGNAWWGTNVVTGYATAPASILNTGVAKFTNITATGTINALGGYIGSGTSLVFESQGINTGVTGWIRGGQTDYRTGTGYFLGYNSATYRLSIGVPNTGPEMYWDGSNLVATNINIVRSFTAGEDLIMNEIVYPSGTNIVERVRPTSFASNSATFTEATASVISKIFRIDSTRTLHMGGGSRNNVINMSAKIGTVNVGETDMTYGSAENFGGVACNLYDICQISTTKFLVLYWQSTATAALKAIVLDVGSSGDTITPGSAVVIDTSADATSYVSCTTLDSGRVSIFYKKNSTDSKYYVQILSISGSTITTNTAVNLDANTNSAGTVASCLLTTDTILCVYAPDNADPLVSKIITVSGTTPTVNGSNTLNSSSFNYGVSLSTISATKAVLNYTWTDGAGDDKVKIAICSISGTTVTKSSDTQLLTGANQVGFYLNSAIISPSVILTTVTESTTSIKYYLIYIDGTTISTLASQQITTSANGFQSSWVCKFKPFKYLGAAGNQYSYVTFASNTNKFIGVAFANIADTVSGPISMRYTTNTTFSGLTAGSIYYVDDSGLANTDSSTLSVIFGIAVNTTSILMQ